MPGELPKIFIAPSWLAVPVFDWCDWFRYQQATFQVTLTSSSSPSNSDSHVPPPQVTQSIQAGTIYCVRQVSCQFFLVLVVDGGSRMELLCVGFCLSRGSVPCWKLTCHVSLGGTGSSQSQCDLNEGRPLMSVDRLVVGTCSLSERFDQVTIFLGASFVRNNLALFPSRGGSCWRLPFIYVTPWCFIETCINIPAHVHSQSLIFIVSFFFLSYQWKKKNPA